MQFLRDFNNENELQKHCGELLKFSGHFPFHQNSQVWHGNSKYKSGTPDTLLQTRDGMFYSLEFKIKGRKQSNAQKKMQQKLIDAGLGHTYLIINESNYDKIFIEKGWILT